MMKERALTIVFMLILIIITFCPTVYSKQGTLKGQVVDSFGNALKDVEVKIKGNKTTAKTDENGQYNIRYNPGKVEISFSKKGYATQKFPLNIRNVSEVPLPNLTFWKLPESGGMFVVEKNDYEKIEKRSYFSKRDDISVSFYVKGNSTKIKDSKLIILDYSKESPLVVGKTLYKVKNNNLIDTIIYKSGNWSIDYIDDEYSKISNRLGLRHIVLEPGKYFYCIGEITLRSKVGYGYYFEIVAPGSSDKENS
ncbi:MAG: carboxypeptidase-like regulatory domain-containing protein [Candidatus Scalinduaceae bacterium]